MPAPFSQRRGYDRLTRRYLDPIFGEVRLSFDSRDLCVTDEAVYYQNEDSYFVRLGDSVISADVSATVTASLAEDLDCQSLLFGRVLSHGLATALRRAELLNCTARL